MTQVGGSRRLASQICAARVRIQRQCERLKKSGFLRFTTAFQQPNWQYILKQ